MIREITVGNIAIIEELSLSFSEGFNVLSGETGAGKSIIVDCMGFVLGGRSDRELVGAFDKSGRVQLLCDAPNSKEFSEYLEQTDIEPCEEYVISRRIDASGKSVSRINGNIVTAGTLKKFAAFFVHLHGQNQSQALLEEKNHINILDDFSGAEQALKSVNSAYKDMKHVQKELEALQIGDDEKARLADILKFQCEEIANADLSTGEEDELQKRREKLLNVGKIAEAMAVCRGALGSDGGATDMLSRAKDALNSIKSYDEEYENLLKGVSEALFAVQEISYECSGREEEYYDERELDKIEERLALIASLKRKYGGSESAVLEFLEESSRKLEGLQYSEKRLDELKEELKNAGEQYAKCAAALTNKRKKGAKKLETELVRELSELGMNGAKFEVEFSEIPPTQTGRDGICFMLAVNVGTQKKPLSKVASGGEVSRIVLGMLNILHETHSVPTVIFDEIDAGISGKTARVVAEKIRTISGNRQVLCVTHLPQIAAVADANYLISKSTQKGSTRTAVELIDEKGKVAEVARLSGGLATQAALDHAKELINELKK